MIFVKRSERPKVLKENADKWTKEYLDSKTEEDKKKALKKYRHVEIRSALDDMFRGKCAYCESKIDHVMYPNIEHFRPKSGNSGQPELCFEWENLLLSCVVCNGPQYKGDKFPQNTDGGPLVNPCQENPEDHLDFRFDAEARIASVYGKTSRGMITEKTLGLNRLKLREYRSKYLYKVYFISIKAISDPEAMEILKECASASSEFSAFAQKMLETMKIDLPA